MSFFKNISDGLKSFKDKEPSSEGQRGYGMISPQVYPIIQLRLSCSRALPAT